MDKTEGTGERVGGYRVVRRLAIGGTSDVLLAKAEGPHGFERSVVLKVLLSQYERDDDFKGMFGREAAAYARLSHPSIVRLYDFFANDGQLVMVLEYIDGPPLNRLRGMLKAVGQQFDDATALYVGGSIFGALAAAHAATDDSGDPAPVIHRDVNPTNVLIPWDGHVKLADFGIAKVTGASHQSRAGLIKGTYGYMAPEQVKGENVTPRADVYAGAIILWEMLTKRRAFVRGALPEIEVLRELAEPRIASIDVLRPELHKNVREAIKRALEPRADKRSMTAEEMASTLRLAMPSDEGRERLAKALASVRHEPKPSRTSMPPAREAASDEQETEKIAPNGLRPASKGMLPKMTPAPRAAVGVARKTAPYGATMPPATLPGTGVPRPSGTGTPRPPVVAPPGRRVHDDEAERKTLTAEEIAAEEIAAEEIAAEEIAAEEIAAEPEALPPSSLRGLAAVLEPEPTSPSNGIRDAIDEVLRDLPSDVPPNVFPKTDPPGGVPASPIGRDPQTLAALGAREIGHLPAAPAPLGLAVSRPIDPASPLDLVSTLGVETGLQPRAMPSSFPAMSRTLSMSERPAERAALDAVSHPAQPVERPPPHLPHGATAPMPAVAPPNLSPSTAKMRAFVVPQAAVGSDPPPGGAGSAPPATLPLGAMTPPLPAAPRMPASAASPPSTATALSTSAAASRHASVPSASGAHVPVAPASAPASAPAKRRGTSVVALFVMLVVVIAAGVVGTVAYVRAQKARASATAATRAPIDESTVPSASSTAAGPAAIPSATTAATAAATPTATATATATTTTTTTATATAIPTATAPSAAPAASSLVPSAARASASGVAAADLPPGTGRVKTAGTIAGRRIFFDAKTVDQTPEAVVVRCGARSIKLGSTGSTQAVDVPCGGEIIVSDR